MAATINEARVWRPTPYSGPVAPQILEVQDSEIITCAFDFSELLNPGDRLSALVAVVEDGSSNTPTIAGGTISNDGLLVTFTLSGLAADLETRLRADATTVVGDRLSALGWVYTV